MRGACRLNGFQADEAANAVIHMDHEVAGGERRHLGNEILGTLGDAPWPHQAVAQNVLLADDNERIGLESGLKTKHRERDLVRRPRQRLRPSLNVDQIEHRMIG